MDSIWRWVGPQDIALDLDAHDKQEALRAIASLCERSHRLHSAPIFRALWRREQAGSTGLGAGFAIPHARIEGIEHPITLFVRTRTAIAFGAPDGKPVSQLFVILVPAQRNSDEHLELLARVAEMFSDRALRELLAAASTETDARNAFTGWIRSRTAGASEVAAGDR